MRRKKISIIGALVLGLVMSGCGSFKSGLNKTALKQIDKANGYVAATMTAGTNGSTCTVNGNDGIKVGTSKAGGNMTVTVPANATDLIVYCGAWKGAGGLTIDVGAPTGVTISPTSIELTADDGISNSSPFTLNGNESGFKFEFTLSDVESSSQITFTSSSKRFVLWDAQTKSGGSVIPPTPTTYTLEYNSNGGTGTIVDENSPYTSGSQVTVKSADGFTAPDGKEFDKWNTAANGSGTNYQPNAKFNISANTTLYAQWKDTLPEGTDVITVDDLGEQGSGYTEFSVTKTATYIGKFIKNGNNMQFNNDNRCIASSVSGGLIRSISVSYGNANGKTIGIYAKNTAYSLSSSFATGTLVGTLSSTTTTVNITGNYAYFALVPSGATYPASLTFVWEDNGGVIPDDPLPVEKTFAEILTIGAALENNATSTDTYKFEAYVREKEGNNYWLTATQNETINEDKSNAFELYFGNTQASEEIQNKLLENAKVELTMQIKKYNGVIENGGEISSDNIVVKTAGTAWSVPEPEVETKTVTEFIALENVQNKAYFVTGTIKYWGKTESANKDKYGNLTLTDGTSDVYIYGCTRSENALAWNNANSYVFTNPQNFLTNEETAALVKGQIITLKLIRADYNNTIEGNGVITNIQAVEPTGVELNLDEFTLEVGDQFALEAFILPQGAVATVTWETSDETIATVDNEGHVEAVAEGVVTITASISEQMKAECTVTVIKSSAKMSVNKNSFSLDLSSAITNPEGFEVTTENVTKSGNDSFHKDSGTADTDVNSIVVKAENPLFNSNPGEIVFKASLGAGSAKDPLGHNVEVCFVDAEGNEIANTTKTVTTKLNKAASLYEVKMNYSSLAYGVKLSHLKENQYNVRYYSMELSYNPLRTFANVTATEVNDGNSVSLENVKLRFGATLTPELREEITTTYGEITRYGVMYFRALNPKDNYSSTPVQDIYKNNEALSDRYKTAESANIDPNENYTFSVALSISSAEQYNIRIAAAPYVLANGTYYFLGEMMYSVKDLADEYIANSGAGTNLSAAALAILAGTNN